MKRIFLNLVILFLLFGNHFFVRTKEIIASPRLDTRNIECLAKIVYFEAGNQSIHGKIAVAYVVHNRAKSPLFPNDYCSVIEQKNQFTSTNKNIQYMSKYLEAECIAKSFILLPDPTKGAFYFHNRHIGNDWKKNRKRSIEIEDHLFY